MAYNTSLYLLIFLPVVLLIFQLAPACFRPYVLLAASYLYFWLFSGVLILYLIGTTLLVFASGRRMESLKNRCKTELDGLEKSRKEERAAVKKKYKNRRKHLLILVIVILVSVLAYLKYYNFFIGNVNAIVRRFGSPLEFREKHLLVPIGISFYTLEAIGFITDVYWDKVPGTEPLGKIALFLGFFPQTMEGPIALYGQTSDDLWSGRSLKYSNLAEGGVRIFWGLFKKVLIADRLYLPVTKIFEQYEEYYGVLIPFAAIAYTIQLYMEFSGCMDIIIGSGRLFGIALPENFNQPFVSRSAAEFWRRWHMSLGVWFRTYIFYPVSASGLSKTWTKYAKKKYGKYITKVGVSALALFPVWLCNGLWHGSSWNYIFYGMYYFVILLAEVMLEPVGERFRALVHADDTTAWLRILEILRTWIIIFTGELFFRANGIKAGMHMFFSTFKNFRLAWIWEGALTYFDLDTPDYLAILLGCIIVGIVGYIREHELFNGRKLTEFSLPIRWPIIITLILAVLIFGAYGVGYQPVDLIYAGF